MYQIRLRTPQKTKSGNNKKLTIHIEIREYQRQRENSKNFQRERTDCIQNDSVFSHSNIGCKKANSVFKMWKEKIIE